MVTLLAIMSNYDYGAKIAKLFKIKQPVVARRLVALETVGLVHSERRGRLVKYRPNWKLFLDTFYLLTNLKLKELAKWSNSFLPDYKSSLKSLKTEALNKKFIIDYFSEYLDTTKAVLDLDLADRDFNATINTFFISIAWLIQSDIKTWNKTVTKYHLNKLLVEELVYRYILIIAGAGVVDIQTLAQSTENNDSK
jgi:DNA-binding transcriptional ArsR family regulator